MTKYHTSSGAPPSGDICGIIPISLVLSVASDADFCVFRGDVFAEICRVKNDISHLTVGQLLIKDLKIISVPNDIRF